MLNAFLSRSGSCVLVPDAIAIIPGDCEGEIKFIDAAGRTLVIFRRENLLRYSQIQEHLDNKPQNRLPF